MFLVKYMWAEHCWYLYSICYFSSGQLFLHFPSCLFGCFSEAMALSHLPPSAVSCISSCVRGWLGLPGALDPGPAPILSSSKLWRWLYVAIYQYLYIDTLSCVSCITIQLRIWGLGHVKPCVGMFKREDIKMGASLIMPHLPGKSSVSYLYCQCLT